MIEFLLPKHTSHSAINSYIRCGKAYELGKLGVEEPPAWWLLGGSAVHKATEWIDKGEWDEAPEMAFHKAFYDEIIRTEQSFPDRNEWRKAGYGARAQGYEHWLEQGPRYVKQWADRGQEWRQVELDVSTTLPSGIIIKGYIDRARRISKYEGYEFVDLKTGSTRPDSDQQLGIYKVLFDVWLNKNNATRRIDGGDIKAYNYMFKDDEFYEMDVSNWTLETVDEIAKEWYNGISSGVFLPNRGKQCGTCGVAQACYLASGDTDVSRRYDVLNPNYRNGE
jgi:CRISPR/Cas system-associated exonuclease Cas4 (RecB family)